MANETSWTDTANSWLQTAINGAVVLLDSNYKYKAEKEAAKVQSSIEKNTTETAAQQAQSTNMVRNVLLVVGGTLGLLLAFGVAKKVLK